MLTPPGALAGRRYFFVSYLPTACASLFVLVLVWAGARAGEEPRRGRLSFSAAWHTGSRLGAAEIAGLTILIVVMSFVLYPLQSLLLRALESRRPAWMRRIQAKRRRTLVAASATVFLSDPAAEPELKKVQEAGRAGYELRRRFAVAGRDEAANEETVKATAFGNALAAAADQAGRPYGLDASVAWPRLYPLLSDSVRAVVDDRRDSLDAGARMTVVMAATTAAALVLLARTGYWCLLALIPLGLAALAYVAAVQAALSYGEAVRVAFDLHRFDLLKALRIELPTSSEAERKTFTALSDFWRQGRPLAIEYSNKETM